MKKSSLILFIFYVFVILSCQKEKDIESKVVVYKKEDFQISKAEVSKAKDSLDIIFIRKKRWIWKSIISKNVLSV